MKQVLSFPKSGRTWIRLFILKYCEHLKLPDPEIKYIHTIRHLAINDALLILLRNPFDLLVSHYFHMKYRLKKFNGTISEFIRHEMGLYQLNASISTYAYCRGNILVVNYEDLFNNIWDQILRFFDLPVYKEVIEKIDKICEISNIKKNLNLLIEKYEDKWRYLPEDIDNNDSHKFRRGVVNGYKDYLSQDDIDFITKNFIGYERLYDLHT